MAQLLRRIALVFLAIPLGYADRNECNASSTACPSGTVGSTFVQRPNTKTERKGWQPERTDLALSAVELTRDVEVTVISYNLYWWNVGANNRWGQLWDRISGHKPFDLIGFQECEDVAGTVQKSGLSGFAHWQGPNKPEANPAPLAWNTAVFSKIDGPGFVKVGADQYGDRIVTWVRLQHAATQKVLFFANTHGPLGSCGEELGNNWVSAVSNNKQPSDLVVLTGDFNCGAGSAAMNKIRSLLPGGIDGGIDFILTQGMATVSGGRQEGSPSDHPLIKATFQLGSGTSPPSPPPTTTAPPAPPVQCSMEEDNIDYYGGDLKQVADTASARECSLACSQEPQCKSYTWAKSWNGCYLKSVEMPGRTSDSCCVSGLPACTQPSPSPTPAPSTCSSFNAWPDIDNGVTCDACTALVLTAPYNGRCNRYCESFGHTCVSAAEEVNENCEVKQSRACDEEILNTSDMLCTCHKLDASTSASATQTTTAEVTPSSTTSAITSQPTTASPSGQFFPIEGGDGRACRGASATDNSGSYYKVSSGRLSLEDCMAECVSEPTCKGIEHHGSGRCEVWTRPGGIQATAPVAGYTCLAYGALATTTPLVTPIPFTPVDGGEGRVCRGASATDNSGSYFKVSPGSLSLEDCMTKCVSEPMCKGIEHQINGRCEVWTRPGGIQASAPVAGYTCLAYGVRSADN